MIIDQRVIMMT